MRRFVLLALIALAGLSTAPACAADKPLTVFAAASLQEALTEAGKAFETRTGTPVRFSFAGSQALARQIDQGAPADLFVSADLDWMNFIDARGLLVKASRRDLASNRLVLIAPRDSRVTLRIGKGMALAKALGGGRLALADPAAVPAGRYARASLTSLGVWDQVAARTAPSESVRGALAFVARGEAPLGIVYATDARAEPRVRVVGVLPAGSHPPIVYPGAILKGARHPQAAAFLGFLQGPEARAIFTARGFIVGQRPG